jgi:hypothetical protein
LENVSLITVARNRTKIQKHFWREFFGYETEFFKYLRSVLHLDNKSDLALEIVDEAPESHVEPLARLDEIRNLWETADVLKNDPTNFLEYTKIVRARQAEIQLENRK